MPYPTKLKGGWQRPRQVVVNKSTAQIQESKAAWKFANKYQDILQNNMAEGPKDPQGPFLYQEGGKTYASLLVEMLQSIQRSPLFDKMQKRLQGGRHRDSQEYNGKGPCDPYANPTGVFTKCRSRDNASDGQSSHDEGNWQRMQTMNSQTKFFNDGVPGYRNIQHRPKLHNNHNASKSRSIANQLMRHTVHY